TNGLLPPGTYLPRHGSPAPGAFRLPTPPLSSDFAPVVPEPFCGEYPLAWRRPGDRLRLAFACRVWPRIPIPIPPPAATAISALFATAHAASKLAGGRFFLAASFSFLSASDLPVLFSFGLVFTRNNRDAAMIPRRKAGRF